jgi:hypothetical protein
MRQPALTASAPNLMFCTLLKMSQSVTIFLLFPLSICKHFKDKKIGGKSFG